MLVDDAYALIARAIDEGRCAHGYLLCGDVNGSCAELTRRLLEKLFPDAPEQIARNCHPDVFRLEPEGRRRSIHVDSMRERIVEPIEKTAYAGGWKVGVIAGADRFEPAAANAFLKTLEEPPQKTLFLLLTDAPELILPTIVSRTQRIDLPSEGDLLEGEAYDALAEIFAGAAPEGVFRRAQVGRRLAEILGELKDAAEDTDVPVVRKAFFKTLLKFVRDGMASARLPNHQAFRNIEAVEEAYRQSDRSISDEAVLCGLAERLNWPKSAAERVGSRA